MSPIFDIATRALVVAYKADGKTNLEIMGLTGIEKRTINRIYARAIERGFDPSERPLVLLNKYLEDAPRSGRPSKQQEAYKKVVDLQGWMGYISCNGVESTQESWIQEDKANKEAWTDEEDEKGEARVVS
ncbi:hypothetical protein AA0113_g12489 [Alternaria arborescens]|uniref:Uncharacterized protein n=1 Tax=Alternaria arborescens TaxID=156630 RepID=A0A4Q4PWV4_9PLEO|nr:hypothetical protein AA0111_g11923 [Alternaria arborescens]RYO14580.1 hypothetical protein AA0111_g11923 [Alternaria arborescens]RYO26428.1 hypothetical protein AA0113_g12489 [Alternaria arborescens]